MPINVFINSRGQQSYDSPIPVVEKRLNLEMQERNPLVTVEKGHGKYPRDGEVQEVKQVKIEFDEPIQNQPKEVPNEPVLAQMELPESISELRGMLKDELIVLGKKLGLDPVGLKSEIIKEIAKRLNVRR